MKVWFSIVPGHGHFYPLLPLARALVGAGHEVAFCTSRSYGEVVVRAGFEAIAVGPDYTQAGAKGAAATATEVHSTVAKKMFVDAPPQVLRDLLAKFERERPDVLLLDPWERGGFVAAAAAGLPHGAVILGVRTGTQFGRLPLDLKEREAVFEEQVRQPDRLLRQIAGLEPHDRWLGEGPFDRTLALDLAPPSLQCWPHTWNSHTSHPLRPEVHVSGGDHTWLDELDPDTPLVTLSFGTLFGTPELFGAAAEAALSTGSQVVALTGFELPIEHVRLRKVAWASLDQLLARTDVFVHHGGFGTTIGALATGTASVMVPLGSDQPLNAARVGAVGAGLTVSAESLSEDLGPAVDKVLSDPIFRLNAERLKAEIASMPAASEVVPLIKRLAVSGGPVLNR